MSTTSDITQWIKDSQGTGSWTGAAGALTGLSPIAAGNYAGEILGLSNSSQVAAADEAYANLLNQSDAVYNQNLSDLDSFWKAYSDTYSGNAAKYDDALDKYLNSDTYQNEDFSYNGNIEDYYDKFANQRAQAATDAITASSASGGNRFSSDYVNQVAAKQQALASEEWEQAYNKLMQDRSAQLAEYNANSTNNWNNYNATQNKLKAAVDAYGNAQDNYMSGLGDYTSNVINARNNNLTNNTNIATSKVNTDMQETNGNSAILGLAGNVLSAIF